MNLAAAWGKNPFIELNNFLFENGHSRKMLRKKLIPIGIYEDNFYICFDLRKTNSHVYDAPMILFDLFAATNGGNPILENHAFPSFEKFIEYLTNSILTKTFTALTVQ